MQTVSKPLWWSGVAACTLFWTTGSAAQQAPGNRMLYRSPQYTVESDRVLDGRYSAQAISSQEIVSNYPFSQHPAPESRWRLGEDISSYPQLQSPSKLIDAVYNLTLEELKKNRKDSVYDTGARWPGVWTRDISYSVLLSLAAVDPARAQASLLRKVKRDRIIQDTGTGGAWPCSSDREVWALAAWEIYLVTGDRAWLQHSRTIIENSLRDDELVVLDPATGLARGESTFLDWREQTYPRWMEPTDIYESKNLGTNAVFYRAYRILGAMNRELGLDGHAWDTKADQLQQAIQKHFALPGTASYGQFLYGQQHPVLSTRSDALANALLLLFEVVPADKRSAVLEQQPRMPYGTPTVYPQSHGLNPYHNQSVWPFVQSFWNLAAARQKDTAVLEYGLASLYRGSALFLSNKENFIVDTGSPVGTEVNSDRQLWSVAGSLAMVYRILFGMDFATDGLHLAPVIPKSFGGSYTLSNFHYRNARLQLTVKGYGVNLRRFLLDGKETEPFLPGTLTGDHTIEMEMDDKAPADRHLEMAPNLFAPDAPILTEQQGQLSWPANAEIASYLVYRDGKLLRTTTETSIALDETATYAVYQVQAEDRQHVRSFLSRPAIVARQVLYLPAAGDRPYLALDRTLTPGLTLQHAIEAAGLYRIDLRYANGSGPMDSRNMCAIRTLYVDGHRAGAIILPQRGIDAWEDYGISNALEIALPAGQHTFELRLDPEDTNMNVDTNSARIAEMRLTLLRATP